MKSKNAETKDSRKAVGHEAEVIWRYNLGQRVKRDNKTGIVINRYSKQSEILDIFYPELYDVKWDDNQIEKSFLWHGLRAI